MPRVSLFIFLLVAALLTAGCAVAPKQPLSAQVQVTVSPMETPPTADFTPEVLYQLLVAELAGQRGQLDIAASSYLAAAKASQDAGVAGRAARFAVFSRRLQAALEAAQLWVALAPSNPQARYTLAPLLLAFGRAPEAVVHYEKFISLTSAQPDQSFEVIANQLSQDKNAVAAMSVMDKLLASRKDNPKALLAHSRLAMLQGQLEQALNSVDSVLKLKAHWAPAVVRRARILALQGKKDVALEYLQQERAGKLADNPIVGLSYARLLSETQQVKKARAAFEALAEQAPRNAEAVYGAGVLALQLGDLPKAEQRLKQVLGLRQRTLEASYYLGRVYELEKNAQQALNYYFSVRHGNLYFNAQVRAANLLATSGQLKEGLNHLRTIRASNDQEQVQLSLVEGELLRKAGKYTEALALYTQKLEQKPDDTALRYARALLAEKLNKLALAEKDLRAIIDREPANAQALNALGYTLADRTDRFDEALGLIQRALKVEPKDAAIIDSLGWVQYRMGNHEKAVEYLRRALELIKDPEIAAHLGEVLWKMGKKKVALDVWEEFLEQFPKHRALLDTMKRFGL
ncbi:MAG: tetratricopeptide repeat protein [Gammaproteobacteria bacterium]|nr:tetratricopeptide repeat protein [Gammaproteobacteria bacterium]